MTANDLVDDLLRRIAEGGETGEEAALTLGLLLERERNPERAATLTEEIRTVLGTALAEQRLTEGEVLMAVEGLLAHLRDAPRPLAGAAWALDKSRALRRREAFIELLGRVGSDPQQHHLAYQAFVGLTQFADEEAQTAIRHAAESGSETIRSAASQFLGRQSG